ncbi:MAG: hypothetical protein OEZ33_09265, partial [Gammaproteobacteria bacterium]|nr:hypothetical protein [Gammaproteobacteria bacterium]
MKDNHISLLAQWHANPLTKDELEQLAQRIKQRLSQHQTSSQYFLTTLQQLIYNWWTEQPQISDLERA